MGKSANSMAQQDLMHNFDPSSKERWLEKIKNDLKGKDFQSLVSHTAEGIEIQPAYTAEDIEVTAQPFRDNLKWDTVQEIVVRDIKAANNEALHQLNRGATSLLFYLSGDEDLQQLLQDVKIEYIRLNLVVQDHPLRLAENLAKLISERSLEAVEIAGSINFDPIENLARSGNWFQNEEEDFKTLSDLKDLVPAKMASQCINVNLFANAGATLSQQLGIALAMLYENTYKTAASDLNGCWVNFAVGSDYFGEIAKLRAFRRLWLQLQKELGLSGEQPCLYCESALRNKTILDAYNNMIRTTSEAMAAVIGGANEIALKSFDLPFDEPGTFGERIAKNQSAILQYESHLDAVKDIAQGSYFIEELTEKLAAAGWDFFKAIEAEGGIVAALKNNWLQTAIEKSARTEQQAFDAQEMLLIGANKYAPEDENLRERIKQAMFYHENNKTTTVSPLKLKRLSESLEKQF